MKFIFSDKEIVKKIKEHNISSQTIMDIINNYGNEQHKLSRELLGALREKDVDKIKRLGTSFKNYNQMKITYYVLLLFYKSFKNYKVILNESWGGIKGWKY